MMLYVKHASREVQSSVNREIAGTMYQCCEAKLVADYSMGTKECQTS